MANNNNKEIGSSRFYKMNQVVSWFLFMTFWFSLSYIPLIIFLFLLSFSFDNIMWYLIGFVPIGPALGSLIASSMRLAETEDFSSAGKDFRRYYRLNFIDSLKLWIPYLSILYLFIVNINYYFNIVETNFLLGYMYLFFTAILTLYFITSFLVQMKFEFRYIDLLKLGLYYFVSKPKRTFGNLALIIIVLFLWIYVSSWVILFAPAIFSYVLVLYNWEIIEDIKKRFIKQE